MAALCLGSSSAWATDTNATLVHTASTSCGADSKTVTYSLDGEKAHYNNEGSGTWQGYAFAKFEFSLPTGETITSATLTWTASTTSTTRNHSIYYLNSGVDVDYDAITANTSGLLRYNGSKTSITTVSFANESTKETDVTSSINAMVSAGQNYVVFQWTNNGGGGDLYGKGSTKAPTLVITTSSSTTSYTVKFQDEVGTTLKDDIVHSGIAVGASVSATSEETANFTKDEVTYTLKSNNSPITTVADAASNIITLVFKEASIFSYTVKGVDASSNELGTISSGSYTEGSAAVSVAYPRWILSGTTLYSSATGTVTYSTSFTPDADSYVKNITYNSGTVENVVFYTEGEDVAGATVGNNAARASKGKMGYTANSETYLSATTLAPGKYQIYMRTQNGNNDARAYNFKVGENIVFTGSFANGTNTDANSDEFTVYENSTLSFASAGSSASGIDYFYVVKTGEPTVSKTISAAGWATYCSPYALDFTGEITNLTNVYIVDGVTSGTTLNLVSMKGKTIPANTGILIEGTACVCVIPVVASSSTDVSANDLVGTIAEATLDAEQGYVLMGSPAVGFYKNNKDFTLGANTAYLPVDFAGARSFDFFNLEAETTGINAVENAKQSMEGIYNLAGQRVAQPTRGLYIVNGKKIVVK